MTVTPIPLPAHLAEPSQLGPEISLTGKWSPKSPNTLFKRSTDSTQMHEHLKSIHNKAQEVSGVLSASINQGVGEDTVLIHYVFKDEETFSTFFATDVNQHMKALMEVAIPGNHFVRGINISQSLPALLKGFSIEAAYGKHIFGFVRENYQYPDPGTSIQVTAKWTCKPGDDDHLEALKYWWQLVGTDAFSMEAGLLRFEVFQVEGEDALIIHETFRDTEELQFHLQKGTAEKYKKDIDQVAAPEDYFFRGPVSWLIRTYSKFLRLPATYSNGGSLYTASGGSMSEGVN